MSVGWAPILALEKASVPAMIGWRVAFLQQGSSPETDMPLPTGLVEPPGRELPLGSALVGPWELEGRRRIAETQRAVAAVSL